MADSAVRSDERTPQGLLPLGALFEAAFKRFGSRMPQYLLYGIVAAAVPSLALLVEREAGLEGPPAFAVVGFAVGFGLFLLYGRLAALMTERPNERWGAIAVAALVGGAVAAALCAITPLALVSVFWAVALIPFAAGGGDASGPGSVVLGLRLALQYFPRCIGVQLGLLLIGAGFWLGLGIAISQVVTGSTMEASRLVLTTVFTWPISGLVLRNLYGDLTGRQIIRGPVYTDPQKRRR